MTHSVLPLQVASLMDTVEVLQAGTPGEREQRLVSMTAALVAARSQGLAQEQRASELLVRLPQCA